MRRCMVFFGLLALGAIAGCGSSGSSSDEDQIRGVVKEFTTNMAQHNYAGACERLTAHAQQEVTAHSGSSSCAGGLRSAPSGAPVSGSSAIGNVTVSGESAQVALSGLGTTFELKKQGDTWRIDDF
jgi:hypothetical protein